MPPVGPRQPAALVALFPIGFIDSFYLMEILP